MMSDIKTLYKNHIKCLSESTNKTLEILNYQGVIFGSGKDHFYFEDDMPAPFRTNPHFARWCPAKGPNHIVKYSLDKKPLLIFNSPNDFWHSHEKFENPFWADSFDVIEVNSVDKLWSYLGDITNHVFIGEDTLYSNALKIKANCPFLTARLNWYRRKKTMYELHCIQKANEKASVGHKAAHQAFLEGCSEYEIHMRYLQAINETDFDLPYTGIVGLNKNAAILHYHGREKEKNGKVLLIDSGASYLNYAADITRTYVVDTCHASFKTLLSEVERLQKELYHQVKVGVLFPDLHYKCHLLVAKALHNCGILKNILESDYEEFVESGLTKVFLPHGLGHMIGVQVHDIGGKQLDEQGNPMPNLGGKIYSSLRYLGKLEENNVVTIEPGIYFIPMLLESLKSDKKLSKFVNWKLVDELIPYGGIRIEDEVVPTATGPFNITREFLK